MKSFKTIRETTRPETAIDRMEREQRDIEKHGVDSLAYKAHHQQQAIHKARAEYLSHHEYVHHSAYGVAPTRIMNSSSLKVKPGHEKAAAEAWRKLQKAQEG